MSTTTLEVRAGCPASLAAMILLEWNKEEYVLEYVKDCNTATLPRLNRGGQSVRGFPSIARLLGVVSGLYGPTNEDKALADQWLDTTFSDVRPIVQGLLHCSGPACFSERMEAAVEYLAGADRQLKDHEFLTGSTVTVADLGFFCEVLPAMRFLLGKSNLNKLPKLTQYVKRMSELPQVSPLVGRVSLSDIQLEVQFVSAEAPIKKEKEKEKEKAEKPKPKPKKNEDEDDEPREVKKEYVFPETTFNLFDFKTLFVNAPDKLKALDFLWQNWDEKAFSFWYLSYEKLSSECKKLFLTNNLMNGFLDRADACRKYSLGVHGVFGQEPELDIRGVWLWRGPDMLEPLKEHQQFEVYKYSKLDPKNPEHKALIHEYWTNLGEGLVEGKNVLTIKYFK